MRTAIISPLLIVSIMALSGCDVRVKSDAPPTVEKKDTTIVNPAPEKKVEKDTTIVNPPPEKK
ncbi:hypothetical protein CfE428DRAFT_6258 [Chthoniobacter flavus Ellin428]|uniref:Lipoprotein n=1 Tax=Chthoniobacter flavus Ellin428 TaxID=497964 RepID=B4DBG7_9BACT|nr:hypothetical protein [Chthoniobacter flavus]EDY16257.1 hypothetical protein CfE428DRAFT_6258 [Chthoniobacter flavus Ellin428]TCO84357.1 hypothetical protein EV701_1366 [Chthoniobacter flavus]